MSEREPAAASASAAAPPGVRSSVGMTAHQRGQADAPHRAAQPWTGGVLVLPGGGLLLGGAAVHDVAHALRLARRVVVHDGIALPARWRSLAAAVEAAAELAAPGTAVVPPVPPSAVSAVDEIGSAQAAKLLGCQPRNVRGLAARGVLTTGRLVAGRLVLDRVEVTALAAYRAQNSTTTDHH